MVVLKRGIGVCYVLTVLLHFTPAFCQTSIHSVVSQTSIAKSTFSTEIEPLQIGDLVPDIEFTMVNYPASTAKLSDFRGKVVILDFWATWCGSCIAKFPFLDSIQHIYKDDIQILLVNSNNTGDTREKVENFFKNNKNKKTANNYKLPTAISDSITLNLFPHTSIPHYVWIDKEGKVSAITGSRHLTIPNIEKILDDQSLNLEARKELDFKRPLFLDEELNITDISYYSVLTKGRNESLPSSFRIRISDNVKRGVAFANRPILSIYKTIAKQLINGFNDKRMILEIVDSSEFVYTAGKNELTINQWRDKNCYSFDCIVPAAESNRLFTIALEQLNLFSPYHGTVELRKEKCLILVELVPKTDKRAHSKVESSPNQGNSVVKKFKNAPVYQLVTFLNDLPSIHLPIIFDTTICLKRVDLQCPKNASLDMVRRILNEHNMDLIESEKEIEMFIVSEDKCKK